MAYFQVKEFATPEQFEAYDGLLLQRSLSEMDDTVKCPRRGCSGTCIKDSNDLAVCPYCQHAFCPRCMRLTHPGQQCAKPEEMKDEDEEEGLNGRIFIRYELKNISLPTGITSLSKLPIFTLTYQNFRNYGVRVKVIVVLFGHIFGRLV